jgi:transcriptional regulator with XRE-family HTH domain
MIYPIQIRAARALLDMSQQELAHRCAVGLATIKRIEAAGRELAGTAQTLFRIQKALEAAGIVFIDEHDQQGPGVRLRTPLA